MEKVISDADRSCDAERAIERSIGYSLENFPNLTIDEHTKRSKDHLIEKYSIVKNKVFFSRNKKNGNKNVK